MATTAAIIAETAMDESRLYPLLSSSEAPHYDPRTTLASDRVTRLHDRQQRLGYSPSQTPHCLPHVEKPVQQITTLYFVDATGSTSSESGVIQYGTRGLLTVARKVNVSN